MSGPIQYRSIDEMPEGQPFEIYSPSSRRKITVTRTRSDGTANLFTRRGIALTGSYAVLWITDPCTAAIKEHMEAAQARETEIQRQDRLSRRKTRDQLMKEAADAKSKPARRRDW